MNSKRLVSTVAIFVIILTLCSILVTDSTSYADSLLDISPTPEIGWQVNARRPVNVRACPNLECAVLTTIDPGTILNNGTLRDDWVEFSLDENRAGYIAVSLVIQVNLNPSTLVLTPAGTLEGSLTPSPSITRSSEMDETATYNPSPTVTATNTRATTEPVEAMESANPHRTDTLVPSATSLPTTRSTTRPTRTQIPTRTPTATQTKVFFSGDIETKQPPTPSQTPTYTASPTRVPSTVIPVVQDPTDLDKWLTDLISRIWPQALASLTIVLGAGFGFDRLFSTQQARLRLLRDRAKHDFHTARGTRQRKAIDKTISHLNLRKKTLERTKTRATAILRQLASTENAELLSAASDYLVENKLTEAAGIGPKLSQRIISGVYRGKLTDLRNAHTLSGISATKQQAINSWISKYQRQLPNLAKRPFPGRQAIVDKYKVRRKTLNDEIASADQELVEIKANLRQLTAEITALNTMQEAEFVDILTGKMPGNSRIDRYLDGRFAPWEPTPGWYSRLVSSDRKSQK